MVIAELKLGLRGYNDTENEFSVIGPKVGFVENLGTNLTLLRRGLVTDKLIYSALSFLLKITIYHGSWVRFFGLFVILGLYSQRWLLLTM
ncbi:GerA spore germination protein [Paenibacillus catalpae]|uniref:GerA spore germination protein n=1 Tax=Paenibacillus catalpae TaxID=1045775 RepID=A0A1I1V7N7_9BACL|nr:GerA spore germination protein [Paenibacillus catalpae]